MTKRKFIPVDEIALQDMIAGESGYSRPTQSTEHISSNVPIVNTIHSETEQETEKQSEESDELPKRTDKKHRRTSLEEYRQTFLQVPRIIDRKPVFVSASTREQLDRIVRQLGDRKMSVSGLIENLALNHLKTYQEDIEQWRKL